MDYSIDVGTNLFTLGLIYLLLPAALIILGIFAVLYLIRYVQNSFDPLRPNLDSPWLIVLVAFIGIILIVTLT